MKAAFISGVELPNGEGCVHGNEGGGYNEVFFSAFVFAFVEFTLFTTCVSKTLGALLSCKYRLFQDPLYFLVCACHAG